MAQYINKDTYVGDTGKQLKDLVEYDSGWITITNLQNGAKNWDSNFAPPQYRKIGKVVYLRGLFTAGTMELAQFVLPDGFRPNQMYASLIVRHGTGSCIAFINSGAINGQFVLQKGTSGLETSLNGICYPVE